MSRKCKECKIGELEILGLGNYGDTILVQCQNPECEEEYEIEPDGLGEGGTEFVEAQMMDYNNRSI